jgi:hypothetical protein
MRTVADQVCAFESRQNRNGEIRPRHFCETNPISLLGQAYGRKGASGSARLPVNRRVTIKKRKIKILLAPIMELLRIRSIRSEQLAKLI